MNLCIYSTLDSPIQSPALHQFLFLNKQNWALREKFVVFEQRKILGEVIKTNKKSSLKVLIKGSYLQMTVTRSCPNIPFFAFHSRVTFLAFFSL